MHNAPCAVISFVAVQLDIAARMYFVGGRMVLLWWGDTNSGRYGLHEGK